MKRASWVSESVRRRQRAHTYLWRRFDTSGVKFQDVSRLRRDRALRRWRGAESLCGVSARSGCDRMTRLPGCAGHRTRFQMSVHWRL